MRLVPRLLVQSFGILALSVTLALVANALRPGGPAPVLAAPSAVQLDRSGGEIGIKDAALLFATGRAVFLDARSQYEYSLSHIQGSISLPPIEFASRFQDIKPQLVGKEAVITYCDGELCPLSHNLAKQLRDAGIKNVYVLKNGWSLWQAEKLPIAKGSAGPSKAGAASQGGICKDCENK
ncbi:MAG: rhodanese-like domain-containing protein [Humidesulfovibrio sp.]|nr:rhodanese-like domain-containing protein [Humidesulfovibrio sp.]